MARWPKRQAVVSGADDAASGTPERSSLLDRHRLKKNFGWALVGNMIFHACSWLILVLLAKLTNPEDVGRFALALAIGSPVIVFANLQLRQIQVTDTAGNYQLGQFLSLRLLCMSVAIVIVAGLAFGLVDQGATIAVITIVAAERALQGIREIFLAFQQKHERLDRVAVSQALQGLGALLGLAAGILLTRDLVFGVIGMLGGASVTLLAWDIPSSVRLQRELGGNARRLPLRPRMRGLIPIAWTALPLGITAFLGSIVLNTPRYFIEGFLGSEALGFFVAVAALPLAGGMVLQSAAMSALPRLSRYFEENLRAYHRLLVKILLFALMVGLAGLAVAVCFGDAILSFAFTPAYSKYYDLLVWMMIFAALNYLASSLGYGMTAAKRFRVQLPLGVAVFIATALSAWALVPTHDLIGAAISLSIGRVVYIAGGALVIAMAIRERCSDKRESIPSAHELCQHEQIVAGLAANVPGAPERRGWRKTAGACVL